MSETTEQPKRKRFHRRSRKPAAAPRRDRERPHGGDKSKKLRIIPLGGNEEVGRNMTVFEYGPDIVILDMGLQFPEEDMPGIDYIIPNIKYLQGKEKNIKGVILSHGHLDHVGAAPLLLEKLGNPPVIGRDLTLAILKRKQEDYKKGSAKNLKTILVKNLHDNLRLGKFFVKFFQKIEQEESKEPCIQDMPHSTKQYAVQSRQKKNAYDEQKKTWFEKIWTYVRSARPLEVLRSEHGDLFLFFPSGVASPQPGPPR